jgi:biotin-dependent carboxylase-like uncharacterized protein
MDQFSLRTGNVMLGNCPNDAALEVTLFGLDITFTEERCVVLAGAELAVTIDGNAAPAWTVRRVRPGSRISVTGLPREPASGCRAYLCVSGGIDVPPVMGSRSTYTRAGLGGYKGRALKAGDVIGLCEPRPLWRRSEGFVCPPELRPALFVNEPLTASDGPQKDAFTEEGIETFCSSPYRIAGDSDRMGYRLEGPALAHRKGADIISDGIPLGAVQVPADGQPIVMMADRQTIGGYAKIAVVSSWSCARLAQRLPGETVRFHRVGEKEAAEELFDFEKKLEILDAARASYRSR